MRRFALVAALAFTSYAAAQQSRWSGVLHAQPDAPLTLDLAAGTIGSPRPVPIANVQRDASSLRFTFAGGEVVAQVRGDAMSGTVAGKPFAAVATIATDDVAEYGGIYEVAPGHIVIISNGPFGLSMLDRQSGQVRQLFRTSRDAFFAGPSLGLPLPVESHYLFDRDASGAIAAVAIDGRAARRVRLRMEEVTFKNNDITLAGTLVLPNGKGPFPAVVRTHGGGPSPRNVQVAEASAYDGVAMLTYDKRGTGTSTGDWRRASMNDLAFDAVAAVDLLAVRADIDREHVGLAGGSQAGWVNVIAASVSPRVKFLMISSGETLPMLENLQHETETELRARGTFSEAEIAQALAANRELLLLQRDAARSGDWAPVDRAIARIKDARWFEFVSVYANRGGGAIDWLMMNVDVDPTALWRRVTIPVLAIYHGKDREVYASSNVGRLDALLKAAGNRDYTIKLFPDGNHEGFEAVTGYESELPRLKRYVPGYFETIRTWINAHVAR
ncbi:MAG TPA: CocE/NonD family hydrolase [Thermoanaerobaculia bacterium]|jgi:fermentation-respiration switch protein FrsA (DUF1100 family)